MTFSQRRNESIVDRLTSGTAVVMSLVCILTNIQVVLGRSNGTIREQLYRYFP